VLAQASAHQVTLQFTACPAARPLLADRRKLRQIVYNLLSNAVKFSPAGGRVVIAARDVARDQVAVLDPVGGSARVLPLPEHACQRFLEITVTDSGIGIDALADMFRSFTQIDSAIARTQDGSGLGLSLSKELAQLHGGTVGVASVPELGSTFFVWLPWDGVEPALP
jgi:signal transduction histidine kinase